MKFGGWAISQQLFDWILKNVPEGGRILEFGSGIGSAEIAKHRNITCIEHDYNFIDKFEGIDYIHRPLVDGFYDMRGLDFSESEYNAILIDGPPGNISKRSKIWEHLDKLPINNPVWIIVDDISRQDEWELFEKFAMISDGNFSSQSDKQKSFGVVHFSRNPNNS